VLRAAEQQSTEGQVEALTTATARTKRHAYAALHDFLNGLDCDSVLVTFLAIENILKRKLPVSAHRHKTWWMNKPRGEGHAKAWLEAGWAVEVVDLEKGRVTFTRR
jgi:hypothetical protein